VARIAGGELRRLADGFAACITIDGRTRRQFRLEGCRTDDEARARCRALASMAARLRRAGHIGEIEKVLTMGAKARAGRPWTAVCAATDALCAGETQELGPQVPTFEQFSRRWTDGELAKTYPDHVAAKDSAPDERFLRKYVYPLVDGIRIDEFGLDDADRIMSSVPDTLSSSTRRQITQVIRRVLGLAVYPARHIKENPIPLPKVRHTKAFTHLYPDEDRVLLADQGGAVPLIRRLFFGVLAREGLRRDELARIRWRDLDLGRGQIVLDENKTDDPRSWALDPAVARALRAWKLLFPPDVEMDDLVFREPGGGRPLYTLHLADELRHDLKAAGVTRPALFERSAVRRPLRVHDLRATFVTVSLANGKTETWVADRTGHRSSAMINRYRRAARTWAELALGPLAPLDEAIPELSLPLALPLAGRPGGAQIVAKCSGERGIRTLGTLAGTHDFQSCTFGHSVISPVLARPVRRDGTPANRRLSSTFHRRGRSSLHVRASSP